MKYLLLVAILLINVVAANTCPFLDKCSIYTSMKNAYVSSCFNCSVAGPVGPQGPQGEKGDPGESGGYDQDLNTTADVIFNSISSLMDWLNITNTPTTVSGYGITDIDTVKVDNATYCDDSDLFDGNDWGDITSVKVDNATHADSSDDADTLDTHHWSEVQTTKVDNSTNADTVNGLAYNALFPVGTIIMFSGTYNDNVTIPCWFIADGTDGTVNLVGQFVRGGSTSGATGGSDTNSHTHDVDVASTTSGAESGHNHTVDVDVTTSSAETGHSHPYTCVLNHVHVQNFPSSFTGSQAYLGTDTSTTGSTASPISTANPTGGSASCSTNASSGHTHTTDPASVTSGASSGHTHAVDPASVTSGAASNTNNMPAYTTLIYVQRMC